MFLREPQSPKNNRKNNREWGTTGCSTVVLRLFLYVHLSGDNSRGRFHGCFLRLFFGDWGSRRKMLPNSVSYRRAKPFFPTVREKKEN